VRDVVRRRRGRDADRCDDFPRAGVCCEVMAILVMTRQGGGRH
jgi:hypothetical protein